MAGYKERMGETKKYRSTGQSMPTSERTAIARKEEKTKSGHSSFNLGGFGSGKNHNSM
jgi:hypothetical protein